LPRADLELLRPHLQKVQFTYRLPLYEAHEHIDFVYFPVTGVASLVNTMADGAVSEVGTIDNEGMACLPVSSATRSTRPAQLPVAADDA